MSAARGVAVLLLLVGTPAWGQDAAASDEVAQQVERMFDKALTGSPVIRPQAARRLIAFGAPAAARLREAAGETNADLAALGRDLVEILGEFDDDALRARLWSANADGDFPWRPSAARSLAKHPLPEEIARFDALLVDPLAAVRNAGVLALGELDARDREQALAARLRVEPDDNVRRSLAAQLDEWGARWALWYLVEDLRRTDHFFDQPTGTLARARTLTTLGERLGDRPAFDATRGPTEGDNPAALAALEERVRTLAGARPELPPLARAGGATPGERLGLELRSCRKGEFFLRWTAADELLVGHGNPAVVALPEGTVAGLMTAAQGALERLGPARFFGVPGCDQETLQLRPTDDVDPIVLLMSKGPEPAPELRPAALDPVAVLLLATLPEGPSPDPRLDRLREGVAAALDAIGGPY